MTIERPVPGGAGRVMRTQLTQSELEQAHKLIHTEKLMMAANRYFINYCANSLIPADKTGQTNKERQAFHRRDVAEYEKTASDFTPACDTWAAAVDSQFEAFFRDRWAKRLLAASKADKATASTMAVMISVLTPDDDPIPDSLADYLNKSLPFTTILELMKAIIWTGLTAGQV